MRAAALLLVDGLGTELLRRHAADAPFLAGLADAGPLTVGFPSTTPISLTSLGTGLAAGRARDRRAVRSARTARSARLAEVDASLGGSDDLRETLAPESVQPMPTVFERAAAAGIAVTVVSAREFRGIRADPRRRCAAAGSAAVRACG